jgi:hypothetical protein
MPYKGVFSIKNLTWKMKIKAIYEGSWSLLSNYWVDLVAF